MRIALYVNVVPEYRIPILELLCQRQGIELLVIQPTWGSYASGRPADTPVHGAKVVEANTVVLAVGPFSLVKVERFRKLLREWDADVVLAEARMGLVDVLLMAMLRPHNRTGRRIALVWWFAGWRNTRRSRWVVRLSDLITALIVRRADGALCYGSRAAAKAIALGLPAETVIVGQNAVHAGDIPALVERARLATPLVAGGPLRMLFVGQILARKHLEWILFAMADASLLGKLHVTIVGDGPDLAAAKKVSAQLSLGDAVVFIAGTYDDFELAQHLSAAEIGILPHAGGLMLNTCMAAGLPVICGEADGTEDDLVIDGITGWRLLGSGPQPVLDALAVALSSRGELQAMGDAAKLLLRDKASPQNLVDRIIDVGEVSLRAANPLLS